MQLGKILGTVVCTRKADHLEGCKLLVVQPLSPQGKNDGPPIVAVDTVQSGQGERVLFVTGSSARMTQQTDNAPVDATIIGVVDEVSLFSDKS